MASVESSGTLTTVVGVSTQTLAAPTGTAGVVVTRVLEVDLGPLATTDILEVIIQKATLTSGALRNVLLPNSYSGTMAPGILFTVTIMSDTGVTFAVRHTAGTAKAIPWKVYIV